MVRETRNERPSFCTPQARPTMNSSCTATVSQFAVVALLAIAACASSSTAAAAAEWSPEEIGAIANAAANSRQLETIDVSERVRNAFEAIL